MIEGKERLKVQQGKFIGKEETEELKQGRKAEEKQQHCGLSVVSSNISWFYT